MPELNRRDALTATAAVGAVTAMATGLFHTESAEAAAAQRPPNVERQLVIQCGLSPQEANCWMLTGELASQLMVLPDLSEADKQELSRIIQQVQTKLLSLPTGRRYAQLTQGRP